MSTAVVSVPCELVPVRVRLGYGRLLSPMELGVLEAIALVQKQRKARGESDRVPIEQLIDRLGVNRRIAVDLIADLWRKNYVALNLANAEASVTPDVAQRYADGKLHELPGAEISAQEKMLMIDKLSGRVLPVDGRHKPRNGHIRIPVENSEVSIDDVPVPQLVAAIEQALRNEAQGERRPGREKQVLAAHVVPRDLRAEHETRWVQLDVQIGADDMTSRLRFRVLNDSYPLAYRERAATRLADLVEQYPEADFARALRARADRVWEEAPSLEAAMGRLQNAVRKVDGIRAGKRRDYHLDLCDQARRLDSLYDARMKHQVRSRVVRDAAGHTECVRELIRAAKRQIVFVSPIVEYGQLHSLQGSLRKKLAEGVHLVLVWGSGRGPELDPRVGQLLAELTEDFPNRVVYSSSPSRTNACLVIADDRMALISGRAPLRAPRQADKVSDSGGDAVQELGVRIAAESDDACTPLGDLLQWTRKAIPDYGVGAMVQVRHGDFLEVREPVAPRPLNLPKTPPDTDTEPNAATAVAFWVDAWRKYADGFRQKVQASERPWAEVVYDEAHRHLLSDALRSAERRILISSRRVGFEMGGTRMESALRAPLTRGVDVTVTHGDDSAADGSTPAALRSLRAEFPGLLTTDHHETNARVLVSDDVVVTGSFDPLSGASVSSHKRRSEIGIKIVGAPVAERVLATLRADPASAPPPAPEPAPAPDTQVSTAISAQVLLNDLREVSAEDEPARSEVIRAHIDALGTATAWSLLDELERKEVDAGVLRVAAAHVLRQASDERATDDERARPADRWWRWLLLDRWESGAFIEAALLRGAIADPAMRPRQTLTTVAAARGREVFPNAIVDAVLENPTAAEQVALTAVGAAELLLTRLSTHADAAEQTLEVLLGDALAEPWRELAAIARDTWAATGRPLPIECIRADSDTEHDRADLAGAWDDLAVRLGRVERTSFRFASSIKAHARLFRDDGPFGVLRAIVDGRDIRALQRWLATQPVDDVRSLVHTIGADVQQQGELMHDYQRLPRYLERLEAVVKAARQIAAAVREPAADLGYELEEARAAARRLAAWRSKAIAALPSVPEPERRLVQWALAELEVVTRWGAA